MTQRAKSFKAAIIGLPFGWIISYTLFAITSVSLVVGSEIAFGEPIFNIAYAIAFVVFANLMPAGLQLNSLMPKWFTVKTGGLLTAVIGTLIMPWKLVEDPNALFYFYSFIGSIFGPILGIMLSGYFIERKQKINLDNIYVKPGANGQYQGGYNKVAMGVLLVSFIIPMSGAFLSNVPLLVSIK